MAVFKAAAVSAMTMAKGGSNGKVEYGRCDNRLRRHHWQWGRWDKE